jgi:hypothetical protein
LRFILDKVGDFPIEMRLGDERSRIVDDDDDDEEDDDDEDNDDEDKDDEDDDVDGIATGNDDEIVDL